ncbi:MAG: peptidylprolyl isomerase [Reyranella sp.]|uniref:peptidylprolyl isomerase n=1 Tax=Reyranella sp. TaxID=1929291 RepID=UPI00120CD7D6|nr:peptidylprolyl isomerase [Reyranella sp.]TAJ41096.1 MAG: peptidylprolyl isomerase [Reyranella sp.]
MRRKFLFSIAAAALLSLAPLPFAGAAAAADKENTLYIDLKDGRVVIEMRPDLAPKHVAQIKKLAREGKYDGVAFHRVIEGFMAQTGDPDGTGRGGMGELLPAEFSKAPHTRGAVSMARLDSPNTARSQFFIVLKDSNFLDGQYTVWGKVTSGMEFVDKIKKGAPGSGAVPPPPDRMIKVQVAADAKN